MWWSRFKNKFSWRPAEIILFIPPRGSTIADSLLVRASFVPDDADHFLFSFGSAEAASKRGDQGSPEACSRNNHKVFREKFVTVLSRPASQPAVWCGVRAEGSAAQRRRTTEKCGRNRFILRRPLFSFLGLMSCFRFRPPHRPHDGVMLAAVVSCSLFFFFPSSSSSSVPLGGN